MKTTNYRKVSRETLSIIAIDDNSTRMTMSYPISVTGSDGKEKRIVVNEAYTVRMMSNGKVNLINYQRRAEETLLPESVTVSSNSLLLGFNYSSNVEGSGSSNGQYTAFKNATKGQDLKPIDGFTPDQRFYLAYAGLWAQNIRDEEILRLTKIDPHSLGKWRVNAALRNLESFFQAFGITEKDPMYMKPEDRVTIW